MVANRHISRIIVAVMAVAVALCLLAIAFSAPLTELFGGIGVRMEYVSKLFDTDEIMHVDIRMDEDMWNQMLSNAISEEYYACDVKINGKTVRNVAVRPKGNTSLSAIAMDPDSDRYSLKLEFDHYVEGQTCWGLDKLILNNNYADATNMKEAIIYDMYQYIGAVSSLYNYAEVSVNGEYWGVYLALEGVEQSFMLRNFGTQDGELYKPDSMEMGGGQDSSPGAGGMMPPSGGFPGKRTDGTSSDGQTQDADSGRPSFGGFPGGRGGFDPGNMPSDFDPSNMPSDFDPGNMPGGFDPSNMPGGFDFDPGSASGGEDESAGADTQTDAGTRRPSGKGGMSGKGGANLNYSDDELDSYSTIWEGEITGTGKADHRRVVTALKNISEGTDLETYLDVDNVLRYMAVHTFSVNMDSLSGSMAHNYYLYEYDGKLNLFPWDYNLSFGGMSMGSAGNATDMVNDAIDTPFSGTQFFDALLADETYLAQYHAYLQQLVDEYVNGGRFDETYNRIRSQIDTLVETDPTAFYSAEEYQAAAQMLYETVKLRAESIDGQLSGAIPSTDDGQRQDASALIDASQIDVKAMGTFNMGNAGSSDSGSESDTPSAASSAGSADTTQPEQPDGAPEETTDNAGGSPPARPDGSDPDQYRGGQPSFPGAPGQSDNSAKTKNLITFGICFAGIVVLLLILKFCKRKR